MDHSDKEQGTISEPEQGDKETVKSVVSIHYSIFLQIRVPDIKPQTLTAGVAQYMFQNCL